MRQNYRFIALLITIVFIAPLKSQSVDFRKEDLFIFGKYVDLMKSKSFDNKTDILQSTAEFFLDRPYVTNTLDQNEEEVLVVNLCEFDCVTFIETVIALSNTAESGDLTFANFVNHLKQIRYRNSIVDGYSSRLHYTSDWVYVNQNKKLLSPIEWQDENDLDTKVINFMSTHRHAYNALKNDDDMLQQIINIENDINAIGGFSYLPKAKIADNTDKIPHMAMIAFTTKIEGLDTTHTGFVYKKDDGTTGFIHASSLKKKVIIDNRSLSEYCMSQRACTGLIIMNVE